MRNVPGASRKGDLAARKLLVEGWNNCRCAWLPCQTSLTLETDQAAALEPPHCTYKVNTAVCWLSPISDCSLSLFLSSLLSPLTFKPRSDLRAARYHNVYPRPPAALQRGCLEVSLIFIPPGYHRKEYSCIEFTFSGYTISGKFFADLKFENEVLRERINRVLSVKYNRVSTQSVPDIR